MTSPKLSIIRDAEQINQGLNRLEKSSVEYRALLHTMAIAVLVHANEHGQVAPIRRFYSLLTENEQGAFDTYVRLFQSTKDEAGKVVKTNMHFLVKANGEYSIDTKSPVENRQPGSAFAKHAEKNLINPDGKMYRPFYERNNVEDAKTLFDDKNIVDTINRLAKQSISQSTENKVVVVSAPFQALMADFSRKVAELAAKINVEKLHQDNVISLQKHVDAKAAAIAAANAKAAPASAPAVAAAGTRGALRKAKAVA